MRKRRFWIARPFVVAAALILAHFPFPVLAADDIEVVANPSAAVDQLPLTSLQAIFSMRIRAWPNGSPIRVFVLPDRDETHRIFTKEVLHVYPYVLRDTWDRLTFTGTGQVPTEVATENELLHLVATTPGAIGYAQKGTVNHENIKIIQIR